MHLLAAASPGPDFVLVTRQSLLLGRNAGLLASLGIALGLSIHIAYSAAGLAALVAHSAQWMIMIKLIGGAYLIYLGIKGLSTRKAGRVSSSTTGDISTVSAAQQVLAGFLCNVFNPKAPIYFLALFTLVLSPSLPALHLLIYGLWLMLLQFLWFSLVATVFTYGRMRERLLGIRHWIDRVFGAALVVLGVRVLMSSHVKT